ncbi:tail fiber [Pseudomonas phage Persinger]|uniref:Tail fiber n=1 Tax=Pseudomonas phage Persinger TaxID=2749430 RepID=A0A7D7FB12_9CAUD|nr:tail protein [Pseudomonas phage Persinger]QMP19181.1 tail fiber [Pseudomonas phage Persinger]
MSRATQSIFGLAGVVLPFAGAAAPNGWLLCHGQAVSRTTYAHLFAVIGTAYGAGDGSSTFNLPDLRGRVAAGKDNMGGTAAGRLTTAGAGVDGNALGAAGGAQSHTLTTAQMPSHAHAVSDPTHAHSVYDPTHAHTQQSWNLTSFDGTGGPHQVGADAPASGNLGVVNTTTASATGIGIYAAATGISIQAQGGGGAHNNTQPTIVLNHIIKT